VQGPLHGAGSPEATIFAPFVPYPSTSTSTSTSTSLALPISLGPGSYSIPLVQAAEDPAPCCQGVMIPLKLPLLLRWRPFTTAPDTSSEKVAAPHDAEWQPPHVRRIAMATGAEYASRVVGIKAAFKEALVSDNMEEASDKEALSDEQHTEALDREMSDAYLKEYDGGGR